MHCKLTSITIHTDVLDFDAPSAAKRSLETTRQQHGAEAETSKIACQYHNDRRSYLSNEIKTGQ